MLQLDVRQMVPINPATLFSASVTGIDIFAGRGDDSEPFLFCSKYEPLKSATLRKIRNQGVLKLYVSSENYPAYQGYLRDHWKQVVDDKKLSTSTRTYVLSEVLRDALKISFQKGNIDSIVTTSQAHGAGIVKILGEARIGAQRLFEVLHHDSAKNTHSVNVACYAALLAKRLGYSSQEQNEIVVGALLHDIGKLSVDDRILRKPGKLDEFEFRAVKKHPLLGYRQLASRNDLNHAQLMMVYQHHEKLDGSGYPVGIVGEEIHPWARLCAVVDIFEALTSKRPFRSPIEHKMAISIIQKAAGSGLDPEIVRAWSDLVPEQRSEK